MGGEETGIDERRRSAWQAGVDDVRDDEPETRGRACAPSECVRPIETDGLTRTGGSMDQRGGQPGPTAKVQRQGRRLGDRRAKERCAGWFEQTSDQLEPVSHELRVTVRVARAHRREGTQERS